MKQLSEETKAFIRTHSGDDVKKLALQVGKHPNIDLREAIIQISGRQAASVKIPSWQQTDNLLYPAHLSMEQCSSELTARYKASIVSGKSLVDLTGGFGVDCGFMATQFERVDYVERQTELCEIVTHNFQLLGLTHIQTHANEAVEYLANMQPVDWIFIDPARRDGHGGKTVAISDCEPDIAKLEELLTTKANKVMVKLSPMLDISLSIATLKYVEAIHVVSVANECKELLLILNRHKENNDIPVHCVNLNANSKQQFVFNRDEEQNTTCRYADSLLKYLYEPNASIMKAGAYKSIAAQYNIQKLHSNSHLYTSDLLIEQFPGRTFEVIDYCSFNKKELKELLADTQKANITIRNFPATVAELRKRIKLADGGNDYLFATTLNNEKRVLIKCCKPTS